MDTTAFKPLLDLLGRVPTTKVISSGQSEGGWWLKFDIDTRHPLAWRTVQEFGYVLNYLSIEERLPTVFMPVSPPPYLNGGVEFLSWVIEADATEISPAECARWLSDRLPDPLDDEAAWNVDDEADYGRVLRLLAHAIAPLDMPSALSDLFCACLKSSRS